MGGDGHIASDTWVREAVVRGGDDIRRLVGVLGKDTWR